MLHHDICAKALRFLALDQIEQAQSGHPGVALGLADVVTVLWRQHMRYQVEDPHWVNRDRLVFSNGHASALVYAALYCAGFPFTQDDLRAFRQLGSATPGHPERDVIRGIDVATGPLGQGLANAIGMAMAKHYLAQQFNQPDHVLFDYATYVMVGDGCLMEGISHEACSLAGALGLSGLIACWDDNRISFDGETDAWMGENVPARFAAYGWEVIEAVDGHDPEAIHQALQAARAVPDKPVLIAFRTKIGLGSDWEGQCKSHGQPLGAKQVADLRERWDWPYAPFAHPDNLFAQWHAGRAHQHYALWQQGAQDYHHHYPKGWARLQAMLAGDYLPEVEAALQLAYAQHQGQAAVATRKASASGLEVLSKLPVGMIGGSADLSASTGVLHSHVDTWIPKKKPGSFIHFGVREFAMFAIANGLATSAGLRPYVSTFLVFSDYGISAVRMAALMRLPVVFVFSHDTVCVGEDGPTHQPIEHLSHLRAIPGLSVWRPANTQETLCAWREMMADTTGPHCLLLSRQALPQPEQAILPFADVACGAYVAHDCDNPQGVILASGSEVSLAIAVAKQLLTQGLRIRVVSVVCLERFRKQSQTYQDAILAVDAAPTRVVIEAATAGSWQDLGVPSQAVFALSRFGASGSGSAVYAHCGFSVEHLVRQISALIPQTVSAH